MWWLRFLISSFIFTLISHESYAEPDPANGTSLPIHRSTHSWIQWSLGASSGRPPDSGRNVRGPSYSMRIEVFGSLHVFYAGVGLGYTGFHANERTVTVVDQNGYISEATSSTGAPSANAELGFTYQVDLSTTPAAGAGHPLLLTLHPSVGVGHVVFDDVVQNISNCSDCPATNHGPYDGGHYISAALALRYYHMRPTDAMSWAIGVGYKQYFDAGITSDMTLTLAIGI